MHYCRFLLVFFICGLSTRICVCQQGSGGTVNDEISLTESQLVDWANANGVETITLGAGCFWCTEAAFLRIQGVKRVVSGYCGGHVKDPTYQQVVGKKTGHVEVCQVFFDPHVVSLEKILEVFFTIHDPTSRDKQGADEGPQYRSAIFFHNEAQLSIARSAIDKLNRAKVFSRPIVTVLEPKTAFYPAEDYHQDYYKNNPRNSYCQIVVREKVQKVQKVFAEDLKPEFKKD